MKKIMFNDKYLLTQAVLEGRKTQTRRIAYTGNITNIDCAICVEPKNFGRATLFHGIDKIAHSRYNVGEEVAVAQAYRELVSEAGYNEAEINKLRCFKGWTNKMYVKADLMPHRIRITDIRAERLQYINYGDSIAEGFSFEENGNPRNSFADSIDHISGKGTWALNPYVFVYEFELIK